MGEPLRISWSQLRTWEECRQKVLLRKRGHRNPAADIRGFFHGTVADRVMREWLISDDLRPGHMVEMVEEIAKREEAAARDSGDGIVRWKGAGDKAQLLAFVRELVERLEPLLRRFVLPYEYEPGKRFKAPVEIPGLDGRPTTVLLVGEMDILCRDPHRDQWAVHDLKATADESYWRKTIGQMVFYDLATMALYGKTTTLTTLLQPMCDQPVVPFVVTDAERATMMQRIVQMAHGIWRKEWTPAETTGPCAWCEVRHACPRWAPVGDHAARLTVAGTMPTLASLTALSVG